MRLAAFIFDRQGVSPAWLATLLGFLTTVVRTVAWYRAVLEGKELWSAA